MDSIITYIMNNIMKYMGITISSMYSQCLILSIAIILLIMLISKKPFTLKRAIIGIIIGVLISVTIYVIELLCGAFLSDVWNFVSPYMFNVYWIISLIAIILCVMGKSNKPFTRNRVIVGIIIGVLTYLVPFLLILRIGEIYKNTYVYILIIISIGITLLVMIQLNKHFTYKHLIIGIIIGVLMGALLDICFYHISLDQLTKITIILCIFTLLVITSTKPFNLKHLLIGILISVIITVLCELLCEIYQKYNSLGSLYIWITISLGVTLCSMAFNKPFNLKHLIIGILISVIISVLCEISQKYNSLDSLCILVIISLGVTLISMEFNKSFTYKRLIIGIIIGVLMGELFDICLYHTPLNIITQFMIISLGITLLSMTLNKPFNLKHLIIGIITSLIIVVFYELLCEISQKYNDMPTDIAFTVISISVTILVATQSTQPFNLKHFSIVIILCIVVPLVVQCLIVWGDYFNFSIFPHFHLPQSVYGINNY